MTSAVERRQQSYQKPRKGLLGTTFSAVFWGWLIGFGINCFFWETEGYRQLLQELDAEYQQQMANIALRNTSFIHHYSILATWFDQGSHWLYQQLMQLKPYASFVTPYINHLMQMSLTQHVIAFVTHLGEVAWGTLTVTWAKLVGVLSVIWVLLFAVIVGAMDGLLERYIRTMEGGRESAFMFHQLANGLRYPFLLLFIYLAVPVLINPEITTVVMSVLFFVLIRGATANLKKFL